VDSFFSFDPPVAFPFNRSFKRAFTYTYRSSFSYSHSIFHRCTRKCFVFHKKKTSMYYIQKCNTDYIHVRNIWLKLLGKNVKTLKEGQVGQISI
jgi:hypothetical protein